MYVLNRTSTVYQLLEIFDRLICELNTPRGISLNAILVTILGELGVFVLGYRYYSKFIAEHIYRLVQTTLHRLTRYKDGVDFVPTNKFVLWGHHFTSVAGAAPILGPAIAVYWGWLPAFLWVILGTVFAAGVHGFRYIGAIGTQ